MTRHTIDPNACDACRSYYTAKVLEDYASPPRCAFVGGGDYNPNNWCCMTVEMLRDYIGEFGSNEQKRVDYRCYNHQADNPDRHYATIELPELEEIHIEGETPLALWVTWYKRGGATDEMWLLYRELPAKRPSYKEFLIIIRALTGNSVVGLS